MKRLHTFGHGIALAALAAATDAGGASTKPAGGPDPVIKADPAPLPLTGDQAPPASTPPIGNDPNADPNPPVISEAAAKPGKKTFCVWVQPGHEALSVGQIFTTPPLEAEALRAAGRARYASDAEVKAGKGAAKKSEAAVDHFEGV